MDIHIVSLQKQPPDYQKKNREDHLVNQGNELQQNPRKHTLLLPYQSGKGLNIIKSLKMISISCFLEIFKQR